MADFKRGQTLSSSMNMLAQALPGNQLLAALSPDSYERLRPSLEVVRMSQREILYEPGSKIDHLYFPQSGWVSMVAIFQDGGAAEVGLVGPEGVTGVPVLLQSDSDELQAMVQCDGTALRVGADAMIAVLDADPDLRRTLFRFVQAYHGQVTRTAACNVRHHIDQRLARWLLMAHDRSQGDSFATTHEFLSMMLGVRRAGISVAAAALQKAGLIKYDRGAIEVTDRPGLENAACDCYSVVRASYNRLLGQ